MYSSLRANPSVPLITPVTGSMVAANGNPPAEKVRESPSGSVASICSETVSPSADVCGPGLRIVGARLVSSTVHVKVTVSERLGAPSSVTLTVTKYEPAASKSSWPDISPLLWVRPGGSPVADHDRASPSGSVALMLSDTEAPSESVRSPTGVRVGGRLTSTTSQSNVTSSKRFGDPSSVARTVTAWVPAAP